MQITQSDLTREDLAKYFKGKVAEIGVERGKFSIKIVPYCERLYCVDLWRNYEGYREHVSDLQYEEIFNECRESLKGYDVEFVRDDSVKAAQQFRDEYLDAVYLDGNHQYEFLKKDLSAWFPKLKKGGIMAGHDWSGRHGEGVQRAVREFCQENHINNITVWAGDKSASYSFLKVENSNELINQSV